jgi:alkylation response protein AidB-like acyl-CoA dehydrogenase
MVGVGSGAMDMTVDYLKQRKQFGKLIGEFQVLQHRAAHLYSELEIARAAALKAQQLLDEGSEEAERWSRSPRPRRPRLDAGGAGRRADARRHRHDRRI